MSDQAKKKELIKAYLLTLLKELKMSEKAKNQPNLDLISERELSFAEETPEEDKLKKEMKTCPTCGRETTGPLVMNVQTGVEFCFACAPPSFSRHSILTIEDLEFMRQCGVDPGLSPVLRSLAELALTGNARKSKE